MTQLVRNKSIDRVRSREKDWYYIYVFNFISYLRWYTIISFLVSCIIIESIYLSSNSLKYHSDYSTEKFLLNGIELFMLNFISRFDWSIGNFLKIINYY